MDIFPITIEKNNYQRKVPKAPTKNSSRNIGKAYLIK